MYNKKIYIIEHKPQYYNYFKIVLNVMLLKCMILLKKIIITKSFQIKNKIIYNYLNIIFQYSILK